MLRGQALGARRLLFQIALGGSANRENKEGLKGAPLGSQDGPEVGVPAPPSCSPAFQTDHPLRP